MSISANVKHQDGRPVMTDEGLFPVVHGVIETVWVAENGAPAQESDPGATTQGHLILKRADGTSAALIHVDDVDILYGPAADYAYALG